MISNQVLQNTLEGLKEISRTEFCIIDTEGKLLATTFPDFEVQVTDIQAFVGSQADSQLVKGYQYFKVCDDYRLEYILVAHGDDEDTYMVGKLAAFQIQNLIVAYKERFDKDSFIKNLLLDNLLLVDIYNRAKKLHIDADVRRVVMMLEMEQEKEHSSIEIVKSAFGSKSQDFITAVDERSVIIVKELEDGEGYEEMVFFLPALSLFCGVSPAGARRRQDFLLRQRSDCIQFSGNRTSDLSASYSALQNVYQRNFRRQVSGRF